MADSISTRGNSSETVDPFNGGWSQSKLPDVDVRERSFAEVKRSEIRASDYIACP